MLGLFASSDRSYLPKDLYVPAVCSGVLAGRIKELSVAVLAWVFLLWAENMASSCLK